jgi:hypothetical protein
VVAGAGGTPAPQASESTHTNLLRVTTGALVAAGLLGPLLLAYMVARFWRDLARTEVPCAVDAELAGSCKFRQEGLGLGRM